MLGRFLVLLLAGRLLELPDVVLGLADAEKELGQSLVEDRPHAADQEVFPDFESVHQLAKLIIGLELLLPLPFGRSRALLRPRLGQHKQDVDASLGVLFFNVLDELIYLQLALRVQLGPMLLYYVFPPEYLGIRRLNF